jgi:hypothetical protein
MARTPDGSVTVVSPNPVVRVTGLTSTMYSSSASAATTTAWTIAL